jgi:DNA-binding NtrC family response regulator
MSVQRLLVVEDDPSLVRALVDALAPWANERRSCGTAEAAIRMLADWKPELVVLDFKLPDGTALSVLEHCELLRPRPAIIGISGAATPDEAFRLAQQGVNAYLAKPLDWNDLNATVQRVLSSPPDAEPLVRNSVGKVSLRKMQSQVRGTMLNEALARSGGNLTRAAQLLGVTRQALQNIIKRSG